MTGIVASASIPISGGFILVALGLMGLPWILMLASACLRSPFTVGLILVPLICLDLWTSPWTWGTEPITAEQYAADPDAAVGNRLGQKLGFYVLATTVFGLMCFAASFQLEPVKDTDDGVVPPQDGVA